MSDKLHRFHIENLNVRGEWVSLKSSWQDIQNTADYPEPVRHVLGEALVAISLLADSLKFDGSLVLQIRGTSPITMLVVQATADGAIRGIAHWNQDLLPETASFNALFGAGTMVISIENNPKPGAQKGERYQSLVSLEGSSLADCFADYFKQSEQLNTRMWLAVNDENAAGLLLQSLPSEAEATDNNEGWDLASVLADTLNSDQGQQELLTLDAESLLYRLYHEQELRLYDAKPIRFECSCSQSKIENAVYSMGETEAKGIIQEQGSISVDCEFCNAHYELDKVDVSRIFLDENMIADDSENGSGVVH